MSVGKFMYIVQWVIPGKIHHPRRMGSFFNPPSHLDFLKHKTPPLLSGFPKQKTPPPAWISGKNILGLNLIYF